KVNWLNALSGIPNNGRSADLRRDSSSPTLAGDPDLLHRIKHDRCRLRVSLGPAHMAIEAAVRLQALDGMAAIWAVLHRQQPDLSLAPGDIPAAAFTRDRARVI